MSQIINVGNISYSEAVAIGDGATATVIKYILPDIRPQQAHNLPPFNRNFIGRTAHLLAIAEAYDTGEKVVVISGLGGTGKTQLALAYAHTHRNNYDIIWLLSADTTLTLDNSLRQLGVTLGVDVAGKDAEQTRNLVMNRLYELQKDVLLIYDNADQISPTQLHPYLPSSGHLLLTSRRSGEQWGRLGHALSLDTFNEAEGMAFWTRRMGEQVALEGAADWRLLGEALGWLPLALELAAAYIKYNHLNAANYLALYQNRRQALWQEDAAPDDYDKTMVTVWELNFQQIQTTPGAADLLNLCCFFAPDDIPLTLLTDYVDQLPPLLGEIMADPLRRNKALRALGQYSLFTRTDEAVSLHRLVQTVARDQMGQEQTQQWVEAAVNLLCEADTLDPHDMVTWTDTALLLPHMQNAVQAATAYDLTNPNVANLHNAIGFYLQQYAGQLAEARPYFEQALTINQKVLGENHPNTATSLNNIGASLDSMGLLAEARSYYEKALAIRQKVLEPEHPDTAQSLNNMGYVLRAMGQLAEARSYYVQALAINQKVWGATHPHTAASLNNMGFLLQGMGLLVEARPYYAQALAIRQKVLGTEHPDTAQSLNNMGFLLQAMGQLTEARPYYAQALTINQKVLGEEHPDTAGNLNNLGTLLQGMGQLAEARPYFAQALAIRQKVLGAEHPDTAGSMNNIGALLRAMGQLDEARPYYEQALAIRQMVLGAEHPDTAASLNNLAVLAYYEKNLPEAVRLMWQALTIYEKVLGSNHPDTQSCRESLSAIEAQLR